MQKVDRVLDRWLLGGIEGIQRRLVPVTVALMVLCLAVVYVPVVISTAVSSPSLLTAPALFMTFHSVRNVVTYPITSSPQPQAAWQPLMEIGLVSELRSLARLGNGLLLVQAYTINPRILLLPDACSGANLTLVSRQGLSRPYGVAVMSSDTIIVTNQNANNAVIINMTSGSVVRVFAPVLSPRAVGVSLVNPFVFINSKVDGVLKFTRAGQLVSTFPIKDPIGMTVATVPQLGNHEILFVGSNGDDVVYALLATSGQVVMTYQSSQLSHPSGIELLADRGILLVMSQDNALLLQFNVATGEFLGVALNLLYRPEDILAVNCPSQNENLVIRNDAAS